MFLVCLLGTFRLLRNGYPLECPISGKTVALLSALALRLDSGMPRETLLEALWPEKVATQSTTSLNSLVYSLHRRLRHELRGASAVICSGGTYFLNVEAGFSSDIARFDTLVASGKRVLAANQEVDGRSYYEGAADLYRGDLCSGTDIYAIIERERIRASFLTILSWLADYAYRTGDYDGALEHGLKLLAYDPCREDAHRVVMRAHVRQGERAQALRQYRLCEEVLRREFDAAPEAETTDLFHRIRVDPARV
jgi:DNA-binding SARP family transcriptional activator